MLDAVTGQNGLEQARRFHEALGLTGVIVTKLDGTAKGGVLVPMVRTLRVPIRFVGVGEGAEDLQPFDPEASWRPCWRPKHLVAGRLTLLLPPPGAVAAPKAAAVAPLAVVGLGEDHPPLLPVEVLSLLELPGRLLLHGLQFRGMLLPMKRASLLLAFAWVVALVATLGSLYYSEVRLFLPCELCWYQRIFMYPQAVLLAMALWRQDFGVWPYSLALSLVGGSISTLHLLEQRFPHLFTLACKPPVPCSAEYIPQFPIPLQALLAFLLIALSMALLSREARRLP